MGREEEGMGMEIVGGQPNVMRESLSGAEDALPSLTVLAQSKRRWMHDKRGAGLTTGDPKGREEVEE
jgi:hypothetical protein|tara:strand:+ start:10954 stop:11154 length:201 start_codon:yes stop_codon:yes gene_type:complete